MHFRGPDVRAAAQQIGRHVDDDVELGLGMIVFAPAAISGNGPGGLASKMLSAFCVWRRLPSSSGMVASVPRYWALRLLHVQLGFIAALEQTLGDLQAALLQRGVLVRDPQPRSMVRIDA